MKSLFYTKTLIALAVAIAAAAANVSQAQEQPIPPPAGVAALPANIPPDSPTAQVVKLVQSGVDAAVIKNFIANSGSNFNLDAEIIISLTDLGVPIDLVNAMMEHDKSVLVTPAAPAPAPDNPPETAPPTTPVTVNYFNDTLTPYGSWVEVEGYGRCWRPTVVIYDSTWRPYCDRGHWVYTDCGWYWDSDYSWGVTFHYGRWFRHAHYGWCWWPETVWAPSWVTWRSSDDYCGWAPLPPFSVYRPGVGFFYRGASVEVGFGFGLEADYFTFVPSGHFSDRRPRYYSVEPRRVPEIFHRTTIINNFNDHNRTLINGGISVDRFNTGGRRPIQPVHVGEIPNAGRQGWRGNDADHRPGPGSPAGNDQLRHGPVIRNDQNNESRPGRPGQTGVNTVRPPEHGQQPQTPTAQPGNRSGSRDDSNRNSPPANSHQNVNPPANNNPAPGTPFDRNQRRNDPSANTGTRNSPPVNSVPPVRSQPVQTPPVVSAPVISRPAPAAPVIRDQPQNNSGEKERRFNAPVTATPPVRSQPQTPPAFNSPRNSAPVVPDAWQQQQRSQPRQNPVVTAPPRNVTPPPVQPPAPVQSQSRGSDRNTDRNADKDKQNH